MKTTINASCEFSRVQARTRRRGIDSGRLRLLFSQCVSGMDMVEVRED